MQINGVISAIKAREVMEYLFQHHVIDACFVHKNVLYL